VGGGAGPRSAALAARFATEYNVVHVDPATARRSRAALDAACLEAGRDPASLRFSMMNGFLVGADEADLRARGERLAEWRGAAVDLDELARSWIVGTPDRVVERLREYADAGVGRVMLQHHLIDDDAALELIASEVGPALAR
jgi:alkanesulfonate monooxygenase SsuD/methylene tetrahydromethanopterin reductase-like flavin-dependent oxidoreductase (luciferase family)